MTLLHDEYISFQKSSPSTFHVISTLEKLFLKNNFSPLNEDQDRILESGKTYFITHQEGKSLIAFKVGSENPCKSGFHIAGSHTDSPHLRLKYNCIKTQDEETWLSTQVHGGIIARSWLDRPLVIAGATYTLRKDAQNKVIKNPISGLPIVDKNLYSSAKAVAIIPDLAIHLDRNKNQEGTVNLESLHAFVASNYSSEKLNNILKIEHPFDYCELSLAPYQEHIITGINAETIVGPRHDDLAMVFPICKALIDKRQDQKTATSIAAFFDSEETGSMSSAGAHSNFLINYLKKIISQHPNQKKSYHETQAWQNSIAISADMAHAYHPNHSDKYESMHKLSINKGLVIKENANDRYSNSPYLNAIIKTICAEYNIPLQYYINRQDISCGSTIGPLIAAQLTCPTVDLGLPMWAMHSTAETMGVKDLEYAYEFMNGFYS